MKNAVISKAAGESSAVTPEQLESIGKFSRRELRADEVYVFSLVLCDNAVDRDGERFPLASLKKLAELYVGKTGIFDHDPKGRNQSSRIFETRVETDEGRIAESGEVYGALRAWAYMVRCETNDDLILEIDAGIKKEVSVGCAVAKVVCSVCGADVRKKPCKHQAGESYNGVACWRELLDPTDAYEWSFVAVPAQKEAGVTKALGFTADGDGTVKALENGAVSLSKSQAAALAARIRELDTLAEGGRRYLDELRREAVKLAAFTLPKLDAEISGELAAAMDERQLTAFCKALRAETPAFLQLGQCEQASGPPDNHAFTI